ncbi:hypothetical protein [Candidatus Formimonas warabiya]
MLSSMANFAGRDITTGSPKLRGSVITPERALAAAVSELTR